MSVIVQMAWDLEDVSLLVVAWVVLSECPNSITYSISEGDFTSL